MEEEETTVVQGEWVVVEKAAFGGVDLQHGLDYSGPQYH